MPETAQPAPETDEKKSRGLGSYVLWAFVAVMVYVLSSGPILRLSGNFKSPVSGVLQTLYDPLEYAYEHTLLHKPLGMYFHLWFPENFKSDGERVPGGIVR